jgi:hypothetical protein
VLAATIRGALGLQRQSDLRAHGTNEARRLRTAPPVSFIAGGCARGRQCGSDQGSCFQMIDVVGRAFDAVDGFRTVVHDPDWPYLVGALRLLIRTFAGSLRTNGGCNGLSSIKPFPETVLLQARNSVDLHVRDPAVPGSRGAVNELSTSRSAAPSGLHHLSGWSLSRKGVNNDATEPIKKVGAVALAGSIALTALPLAHSRKNSRGSSQPRGPYSALRIASALSGAGHAGMAQAASVRFTAVSIGRDALPAGKPLTPLDTSQQPRKNDTGRGEERKSVERDHPWGESCGQEHDLERLGADL